MKQNDVYKEDEDAVEFLRRAISSHSGRGAYNVIMADANAKLRDKIIEMTSFLDASEFSFVNL